MCGLTVQQLVRSLAHLRAGGLTVTDVAVPRAAAGRWHCHCGGATFEPAQLQVGMRVSCRRCGAWVALWRLPHTTAATLYVGSIWEVYGSPSGTVPARAVPQGDGAGL